MSHSSRESELAQLREALLQLNSEFFLTLKERRNVTVRIQGFKAAEGRYAHFDPEREKQIFEFFQPQLKTLTLKELLAFSLVMEEHAMAMAPGSYPSWSGCIHIASGNHELFEMINPLILRYARPDFFQRLTLSKDFSFLKDL